MSVLVLVSNNSRTIKVRIASEKLNLFSLMCFLGSTFWTFVGVSCLNFVRVGMCIYNAKW